jgi:hypothetical protein
MFLDRNFMLILIDTSLSAYWIGMVRTGASGTMPVSAREKNSSKNVKEGFRVHIRV